MKTTAFPSRVLPAAAALLAALALAGCGDDDKSSDTQGSAPATTETGTATEPKAGGDTGSNGTVKLSADPSGALKFTTDSLQAKAGKVTLVMDNPSSVPHAVAVDGNGVDKDGNTVGKGGTSTVEVDLKPGEYTFYCPVDGHKSAGMKGTLTVK
jgi:plastocyanin